MTYLKFISLSIFCVICLNFTTTEKPLKVVIDAGHGGKDAGVTINTITEKDIVYAISQKIKAKAKGNIEVILLRNTDQFISLKDRVKKINTLQPDLVLSLHIDNSKLNTKHSQKAYIYKNKQLKTSYYYATKLLEQFDDKNQKIEFAGFYILKQSNSPALNLTLGNFRNNEDLVFLSSETGQDYIAEQILKGLQ